MFTTATASSPFLSVVSLPPPIAAVQNEKVVMGDLKLKPGTLAEMIKLIDDGTISSKIGKELLPSLLEVESLGPPAGSRPEDPCHCCSAALCD
jgi:aspartyl-tRNA(Asn)/glutamyl-tRNA(Gln) amidotransferase subunit B